MKLYDLKKYGSVHPLQLEVCTYPEGNLAITMTTWEDGAPEPWDTLTVNLDGVRKRECAFIDTNNNGQEILKWIADHKLGVPTGLLGFSGYCVYPEYHFFPDALKEMDPEGYTEYQSQQK
ncbi:DUF4313 domain-containing protein [Caproicibacter sp. BJN0012]|uniref:DUF4313 domain-containing protein n=1 Tax=Caproicibacter sp. BJN0012 TaxID=3110227 RepID=UPI002E0FEBD7